MTSTISEAERSPAARIGQVLFKATPLLFLLWVRGLRFMYSIDPELAPGTKARWRDWFLLARRGLELGVGDDARIEACRDLGTLERWHDQAVTATSVAEALT